MRALDDKIIYKLNTSVPTQSFTGQISAEDCCKQLHEEVGRPILKRGNCSVSFHLCIQCSVLIVVLQMSAAYRARPVAIQRCIDKTSERVSELRARRDRAGEDDPAINRALRKEQTKVSQSSALPAVDVYIECTLRYTEFLHSTAEADAE